MDRLIELPPDLPVQTVTSDLTPDTPVQSATTGQSFASGAIDQIIHTYVDLSPEAKIFAAFILVHPNMDTSKCNWYIGDEHVDATLRATILADQNMLYGIPVTFVPGAVGAILLAPNYAYIQK